MSHNHAPFHSGGSMFPPELVHDKLIGKAMETVAADTMTDDVARQAGHSRDLWKRLMKCCIKTGDLRQMRAPGSHSSNASEIVRLVQRRERY
jgi:hypothetical protein